ncbi:MAG: hypothetical protein H0U98_04520 [Alphaproteobacteria bacterium]|nr:hypothetical protein [Alphaproteobacteria bacterium]
MNEFRAARSGEAGVEILEGNALRWLIKMLPAPLDIVDFGGATGEVGAALRACGYEARYTVVENPTLVAIMVGKGEASFTAAIPPACDVFFTSGTLQCVGDPYGVLEQGFAAARSAVVLKRNNFSERDIFRVHRSMLFENGSGEIPPHFANIELTYPFRTVRESLIREIAAKKGFRMFSRTPEDDGVPIPGDGVYGAQLTFLRCGRG